MSQLSHSDEDGALFKMYWPIDDWHFYGSSDILNIRNSKAKCPSIAYSRKPKEFLLHWPFLCSRISFCHALILIYDYSV